MLDDSDYEYGVVVTTRPMEWGCYEDKEREPESYTSEWEGEVCLYADHADERLALGTYRAFYLDVEGALLHDWPLFDVLDGRSETAVYLPLYTEDAEWENKAIQLAYRADELPPLNLLVLDRLIIDAQHRGHGIGLRVLRELMFRFELGAGLIAMKPFALQFEAAAKSDPEQTAKIGFDRDAMSFKAATKKLCQYYAKLGFKRLPKTDLMIRAPLRARPLPKKSLLKAR